MEKKNMDEKYKVTGMTCGGCATSVTRAIQAVKPELKVEVSLEAAQVRVTGEHNPADIKRAVEDAGFDYEGAA